MKFKNITYPVSILVLLLLSLTNVSAHGDMDMPMVDGYMKGEDDNCIPTKRLVISSVATGEPSYDKDEYYVDKDTCYRFVFINPSVMEHDMQIDAKEGENGITEVMLHLMNRTSGPYDNGTVSQIVKIPNLDTEFTIYCTLPFHREGGMEAKLIVGDGKSEDNGFVPGITIAITVFGLFTVVKVNNKRTK